MRDIRQDFEREFSVMPFEFIMDRQGEDSSWPGSYRDYAVECAWCGYLAASKKAAELLLEAGFKSTGVPAYEHLASIIFEDKSSVT